MTEYKFIKALPVWEEGKENELNYWLQFRTQAQGGKKNVLALTGSCAYTVKVNGEFVAFGPARCAHGFYRVDELDITSRCTKEENIIAISVFGYNCNSYYHLNQPSFLCAELICDGKVTAATGSDGFIARYMSEHERKTEKFSFQRTFTEVYNLGTDYRDFEIFSDVSAFDTVKLVKTADKKFIVRDSSLNTYYHVPAKKIVCRGSFTVGDYSSVIGYGRHIKDISPIQKGFTLDEITTNSLLEARNIENHDIEKTDIPSDGAKIAKNHFAVFEMERNTTGEIEFDITCENDTELLVTFSELIEKEGEPVDFRHAGVVSVVIWRLKKGSYRLSTAEPYTGMYIKFAAENSDISVSHVGMNYFGADKPAKAYIGNDAELRDIFDAALETYRQNTFTVYMDCPSRERAGWLCDSFFTSRVEKTLTGKSETEKVFLENFLLPDSFEAIPQGMLPMCYPGDHLNGNFIPNWAMWYILELEEYLARTGDRALIDSAKEKVYALLAYLLPFENEYSLLEKLKGWVFVEWSKSNELTQDVNFPTNMLYARMLESVARLYDDEAAHSKAQRIKQNVNDMSFTGEFYCDNAIRSESGKLVLSGKYTESCQYYAFFCGTATFESRPQLWETLLRDFGPGRVGVWPDFREDAKWKNVYPSNAFIGDYLRLELIFLSGNNEKLIENIKGFFTKMARTTGTLWENETSNASCNHGFASHVIYWMDKLGMVGDVK